MSRINHLSAFVVLLVLYVSIVACSSDEQPENVTPSEVYLTLTINATKNPSAALTRALSIGENTNSLTATWSSSDKVLVYKSGGTEPICTLSVAPLENNPSEATLTGEVSADNLDNGDNTLTLKYLSPDYSDQDGTLDYIAQHCDYAVADVSATKTNESVTVADPANFINQQAIVKFVLVGETDAAVLNVKSLNISSTNFNQTISRTDYSKDPFYVAIPNESDAADTYTLTATVDGIPSEIPIKVKRAGVTFEKGKFYSVKARPDLFLPLTFEASTSSASVTIRNRADNSITVKVYRQSVEPSESTVSKDGDDFSLTLNSGDRVVILGDNTYYYNEWKDGASNIACTGCYVYGNMMSLIKSKDFSTCFELPAPESNKATFRELFKGNSELTNHPTKDLLLPATTLRNNCYQEMFSGCENLTRAPELPAPKLVEDCYTEMFNNCVILSYVKCLATEKNPSSLLFSDCVNKWLNDAGANVSDKYFYRNEESTFIVDAIPNGWTIIPQVPTIN